MLIMALREIKKHPRDEILRKKSRKVDKIDQRIITLLDDMAETMYKADGVGLAAPQVGILKRIVVIDVGDGLIELINPEIIDAKGSQIGDEGCLSLPGITGRVKRPNEVKLRALNRKGEEIEMVGTGLLARAMCHETDHLDGILFIDKAMSKSHEE
ncbi:MAG: peptide deformylase [Xylanivirga thermophila]|jgi:peptide deformylase